MSMYDKNHYNKKERKKEMYDPKIIVKNQWLNCEIHAIFQNNRIVFISWVGGQGSLTYWSPWGHKESDATEWLNWILITPHSSTASR